MKKTMKPKAGAKKKMPMMMPGAKMEASAMKSAMKKGAKSKGRKKA